MQSLYYDGSWHHAASGMDIVNPFTGAVIGTVGAATDADAAKALASAAAGRAAMKALTSGERSAILHRTADAVAADATAFAAMIVAETGKPLKAAEKEVRRCVNTLRLSAEEAVRLTGETIRFDSFAGGEARQGFYAYEPLGLIVAITPFNDPLNLVAHKLGPAIAAGNSVLLKPAEQAPIVALMLVKKLLAAGLPPLGLAALTGRGSDFGDLIVASAEPAMISFTGGVAVANRIAAKAGIKKLAMELGANSPVIVMADADIETAAASCVSGAFWAAGQNCIGVQRILVEEGAYVAFRDAVVRHTKALVVGDPMLPGTDIGPMIGEAEAARVEAWVRDAVSQGGRVLAGGKREGSVMWPTVLENVPKAASVICSEVFGPVVTLVPFGEFDEAMKAANAPDHTIHAAIFTRDVNRALGAARAFEAAGVMINESTDYRLDAMPFGGAKKGSMGREGVKFAVREMSQTKVVCFTLA
ncbi:aldehyde dehydrogenase family protein [Gimibacter soli]|uniref:Aldehyde dehydrogenase family protein n=1 Tax=Gimibacter soli TaxID=3024400 RepID=A0AAE9XNM4_9PROT|nr:aldehyde dehydrogenase family protein [Gimibacter soli]WCL53347.1 aldehyde dehydrogenase family protein [Gimibacter soli]